MTLVLALVAWPPTAAARATALAATPDQWVTYRCDEVVAIGRVKVLGYADMTQPGDILGRGRYDMRLTIKRVLRGQEGRRVVPLRGYSHGQMREDVDFWLVLSPTPDGGYLVRTANLRRLPFTVAPSCS